MRTEKVTTSDVAYYMRLPYSFSLIPDPEDGGFVIKVNELPGCISQGDSAEEAFTNIRDAMEAWIAVRIEDGEDIPEPSATRDTNEYSGKFLVRVPRTVHGELSRKAKAEGVSLNLFVASILSKAVGEGSQSFIQGHSSHLQSLAASGTTLARLEAMHEIVRRTVALRQHTFESLSRMFWVIDSQWPTCRQEPVGFPPIWSIDPDTWKCLFFSTGQKQPDLCDYTSKVIEKKQF